MKKSSLIIIIVSMVIVVLVGWYFFVYRYTTAITGVVWGEKDLDVKPETSYYKEFKVETTSPLSIYLNCKNPSGEIIWSILKCNAATFKEKDPYIDPNLNVLTDYSGGNLKSQQTTLEQGTYTFVFIQMNDAIGITKFDVDIRFE